MITLLIPIYFSIYLFINKIDICVIIKHVRQLYKASMINYVLLRFMINKFQIFKIRKTEIILHTPYIYMRNVFHY
jgi:hypothetical protein